MSSKVPREKHTRPEKATKERPRRRQFLRRFWLPAVLVLALAAGGLTGIVVAYQINYSRAANEVASLATYRPSVVTRVYADDGETVIGEFALEKRIPLKHEEIPKVLKDAILAIEDTRFYEHIGIDPIRILGAVYKNLTTNRVEGGSTLTQQLTKNLFLSREQTLKRKVNEWVMALQIERYYTKQQIMEMYVNHIFLGANAYGFEAAAETYFGKQAKDLTLEEAALLAGIPRSPAQYSPTLYDQDNSHIVRSGPAIERRNLVLDQMAKNGFATQEAVNAAKSKPIVLADTASYLSQQRSSPFDYPVEEIRQQLEDKYTTRVAQSGLRVYSTINVAAQTKMVEVVRAGLRRYDRSHAGWHSKPYTNIAAAANNNNAATNPTQAQLDNYRHPDWYGNKYEVGRFLMGLVMKVDRARNETTVRFGTFTATVTAKDMGWSGRQPRDEFIVGDLAEFEIKAVDEKNHRLQITLSQVPGVQGAMVTLNAHTGEIVAMVGGYDFYTNKFNNATQAYRQTGSCFKPFIYTAALEWGMTPDTVISGAPIKEGNWQPHNYDGSTSNGDVPMKVALAKSLNIPAVHTMKIIRIPTAAQMVRRFGITAPMAPYLPSALGATEVPLIQMVSAYSAFPNRGVRAEPHLIRRVLDRDDAVLEEWEKTTYKVTSEYVALTMVSMMRGVIENGTATGARVLGVQLGGKTGTVNDHTDVWFIGYTPTYVTGVWMGYPGRKKPLGNDMTGGHGALPFFVDFMKDYLKDKQKEVFDKPPAMPQDIRNLQRERQRDLNEDLLADGGLARTKSKTEEDTSATTNADPKMEQTTIAPPAPNTSEDRSTDTSTQSSEGTRRRTETNVTRPTEGVPPPIGTTRPREVEPQKTPK